MRPARGWVSLLPALLLAVGLALPAQAQTRATGAPVQGPAGLAPIPVAVKLSRTPPAREQDEARPLRPDRGRNVAAPPAAQEPEADPAVLEERQMGLMEARILSRQGDFRNSLARYKELRRTAPRDTEIWEDFIETLMDNGEYGRAQAEIGRYRRELGRTPRSERLAARLASDTGRAGEALEVLDAIIAEDPAGGGAWSDKAFVLRETGDQAGALQATAEVLERDPGNEANRRLRMDILKDRAPELEAGWRSTLQSQDTSTQVFGLKLSGPADDVTRVSLMVDQVRVDRPGETGLRGDLADFGLLDQVDLPLGIRQDLTMVSVLAERRMDERLEIGAGIGGFSGSADGFSPSALARYAWGDPGSSRAEAAWNRPWYDTPEAADSRGTEDRLLLAHEVPFRDVWRLAVEVERLTYQLKGMDYGEQWAWTGILSRRVLTFPETTLYYSYRGSSFSYEDGSYRPVDMIAAESVHSFYADFLIRPISTLDIRLIGGARFDTERSVETWFGQGRVVARIWERLEAEAGYEWASEAQTAAGGETQAFSALLRWTW